MRAAYVDTSVLLAEALGQGPAGARHVLDEFDTLFASRLLEAEFLSGCRREAVEAPLTVLEPIRWVAAGGSLLPELRQVLQVGYVRGADAWHLATALTLAPQPRELVFFTFDARQREVARTLGFRV